MAEDHHHHHDFMVHRHRNVQGGTVRAAVFGVSDGLVSNVALITGVAAANAGGSSVLVAGVAGLLAGAASMAAGEYVSVKAQAELVERELNLERISIAEKPGLETRELAAIYAQRGIDTAQAMSMAEAVHRDADVALEVHAREELGVDPNEIGNPVAAALSSFASFAIGALVPLIPWFFSDDRIMLVISIVLGLVATAVVGWTVAVFTGKSKVRTAARQVLLGSAACALTWLIGSVLGANVS